MKRQRALCVFLFFLLSFLEIGLLLSVLKDSSRYPPPSLAIPKIHSSVADSSTYRSASSFQASDPEPVPLVEEATQEEFYIAGYVFSDTSVPLADAGVSVFAEEDPEVPITTFHSEPSGYYRLTVPSPGYYRVASVPYDFFLPAEAAVIIEPTETSVAHHFHHTPAPHSLKGRVVDAETSAPVAGAEVTLLPIENRSTFGQPPVKTHTDHEGRFTLRRLAEGFFYITVQAKSHVFYNSSEDEPIYICGRLNKEESPIRLAKGLVATVRVLNSQNHPVPNADVRVIVENSHYEEMAVHQTKTNALGLAALDTLPPASFCLAVTHPDYAEQAIEVASIPPDATSPVFEITLPPPASISGVVTKQEGAPIENSLITVSHRLTDGDLKTFCEDIHSARTDSDGRYMINGLQAGSMNLSLQCRSSACVWTLPSYQTFELATGEQRTDTKISIPLLEEGVSFSGTVIDEASRPIPGANVKIRWDAILIENASSASPTDSRSPITVFLRCAVITDDHGVFTVPDLPQIHHSDIRVNAKGFLDEQTEVSSDAPVTIQLHRSASLAGTVVAQDTRELIPGAKIIVFAEGRTGNEPSLTTSENGSFSIGGLRPDIYTLKGDAVGFALTIGPPLILEEGQQMRDVVFELNRGSESR